MTETPDRALGVHQWKWRGDPGHLGVLRPFAWHLHTDVGRFCISSVGECRDPEHAEDDYESVVLQLDEHGERVSWLPLEVVYSKSRCQAEHAHVMLCRAYSGTRAEEEAARALYRQDARFYALVQMFVAPLLQGDYTTAELLAAIPVAGRVVGQEKRLRAIKRGEVGGVGEKEVGTEKGRR